MGDESYELEVLLGLRKQDKGRAEDEYGQAVAALERGRRRVVECEQAIKRARQDRRNRCQAFDEGLGGGGSVVELQRFERFNEGMKEREGELHGDRERALEVVRRDERELQRRKTALIEATKALKAVEKHHEAWLAEQAIIRNRKESANLDDIAARIWRENQR